MIELEDIKKLQLNKNDTIVIKLKDMTEWEFSKQASFAYSYLKDLFPDNKVLILDNGSTLAVLAEETI